MFLIVIGKVPELLDVLNATKLAGAIPVKNLSGFIFANSLTDVE